MCIRENVLYVKDGRESANEMHGPRAPAGPIDIDMVLESDVLSESSQHDFAGQKVVLDLGCLFFMQDT